MDPTGRALGSLQRVCEQIADVGAALEVIKAGEVVARGWDDPGLRWPPTRAPGRTRRLVPYSRRRLRAHIPELLHATHALVADELDGVIDMVMTSSARCTSRRCMPTR